MAEPTLSVGEVSKGGERWLEVLLERFSTSLTIWARADPRVEEFVKSLANDSEKYYTFEHFGPSWKNIDPEKPCKLYHMAKDIDCMSYSLNNICGSLVNGPSQGLPTNISFLRIVGIGTTEGVKFKVPGPFSRAEITPIKDNILAASRQLFRDYVVPVRINLRVISTEL